MKINLLPSSSPLLRLRKQVLLLAMVVLFVLLVRLLVAWNTSALALKADKESLASATSMQFRLEQELNQFRQVGTAQALDHSILTILHNSPHPAGVMKSIETGVSPWGTVEVLTMNGMNVAGDLHVRSYFQAADCIRSLTHNPLLAHVSISTVANFTGAGIDISFTAISLQDAVGTTAKAGWIP